MSGREYLVSSSRVPSIPAMLCSIVASGRCSAQKPTNIVPWSLTVP